MFFLLFDYLLMIFQHAIGLIDDFPNCANERFPFVRYFAAQIQSVIKKIANLFLVIAITDMLRSLLIIPFSRLVLLDLIKF